MLTTTYTDSTERGALDQLAELGADIGISYDIGMTRLRAEAWEFHRRSGFSTADVGSSHFTHSAQVTGLEWIVRASAVIVRCTVFIGLLLFEAFVVRRRVDGRTLFIGPALPLIVALIGWGVYGPGVRSTASRC